MANDIQTMREKICEIGRLLFDRKLTDAFGGNISARVEKHILITPRYAGYIILMSSSLSSLSAHTSGWVERTALLKEELTKYGKLTE